MTRSVKIYKKGDVTCVDETINGKTEYFTCPGNRELKVIQGGVIILPDINEVTLNNFKILRSEVEDNYGATTDVDFRNEILTRNFFKKGGGGVLGGNPNFSENITSTVNLGGIKIGDNFTTQDKLEKGFKQLLSPYVSPSFSLFLLTFTGNLLSAIVGQKIEIQKATLNYNNDSENNAPTNITIEGEGFNISVAGTNKESILNPFHSITKNIGVTESWQLKGFDKNSVAIPTRFTNFTWYNQFLFGASPLELDSSNFQSILDSLSQVYTVNSKNIQRHCASENENTSNYTYVAYNAVYTDLNNVIMDGAAPVLGAFTKIGDFNWGNAFGLTIITRVYRSNDKGAFSTTNYLNFS